MRQLNLSPKQMQAPLSGLGRFCRVVYANWVDRLLESVYGRKGLCLKIMRYPGDVWEGAPLSDVVKLQNIAALQGLAPRVYDIVQLPDGMLAQVTDWTPPGKEPTLEGIKRLANFLQAIGAQTAKRIGPGGALKWDLVTSAMNWSGDKFLDWGGLTLHDPQRYEQDLRAWVAVHITGAHRGEDADHTYQGLPAFQLGGSRNFAMRVTEMGLDKIDFAGKTVLDLGCNLGAFCFYASEHGARRAVGVDLPFLAIPMCEVANWLGYWNVDVIGATLPQDKIVETFDIVLALSICNHVGGYASWIADLCGDTLILEGHGGDAPEKYLDNLKRDFNQVTLTGYTTDMYKRPVFVCRKAAQ